MAAGLAPPDRRSWWSMTREPNSVASDPDELWRPPPTAPDGAPLTSGPVVYEEPPPRTNRSVVAFVTVQGLITEEHDIFRTILGHLPGIEPLNVGHELGSVAGPGGARTVDATFDQVTDPDIVVVPGALGTRQLTGDRVLCSWLHVDAERVITATGSMTAFEAAYLVIQRELGDSEANRVREVVGSQNKKTPA